MLLTGVFCSMSTIASRLDDRRARQINYLRFLISLTSLIIGGQCKDLWTSLNETVNGNLHAATPLSLPCFSVYEGTPVSPDPAACSAIQANYTSPLWRAQFYNGFMNNQDEWCTSNATDQCLLNNALPTDPTAFTDKSCNQGSVSDFYIEVRSVGDVLAALDFSRKTGTRLSIKNSGHDFVGRNSLKGSLALWMRKLGGITRTKSFVPEGCSHQYTAVDAITTAAGVNTDEVYKFADEEGVTIIGPYAKGIAISGGWVQAGGHSVLSPVYGLGIDRVLQYKVVTTDGVVRVANECQNPDLFWALRGGGGGTFGIVMEATHKVEPAVTLSVAEIKFTPTASTVLQWWSILVNNSLGWANQGWGSHFVSDKLISVTPLLNLSSAVSSMSAAADFATANNGSVVIESLPSWYCFYAKYLIPNEAPVGGPLFLASRLIPVSLFSDDAGKKTLFEFLEYLMSVGFKPYVPATAPWLYPWVSNSTSATPAWRDSLWELGMINAWAFNNTAPQREDLVEVLANVTTLVEKITPGSGTYFNEADPWTVDWRENWWGLENYGKLLKIKRTYDPEGLLSCWKCVGFEEKTASEKYPCYAGY